MASTYCVIMAGGIGSRFWPVSTSEFPKQFHDILGTGKTLIQQTFHRLTRLTTPEKILVVTHQRYADLVAEQLPDMPRENIILEPARRNTAPCITYAAYRIKHMDPQANMLVAPSDHLITDEPEFERITKLALRTASEHPYLLTLGIKPHRPDTGYGYIQFTEQDQAADKEVKVVKTFTEKPGPDMAQQFLDSGDFLWNSGIFIWSVSTFLKELQEHQPELKATFEQDQSVYGSDREQAFMEDIYPSCRNESIDYGLMEKSSQVFVIPADFGWSDLGTWGSLYGHAERDKNGNAIQGKKVLAYECHDNIVHLNDDKVAVLDGLEAFVVIDTPQALLVCPKENEQYIKSYVNEVKLQFGDKTGI